MKGCAEARDKIARNPDTRAGGCHRGAMADGTLYGLIGALGGAGITSMVAYFAPARLHRLQAAERRYQDEHDEAKAIAARLAKQASDKEQERAKQLAQDLQTIADYTVSSGLWGPPPEWWTR